MKLLSRPNTMLTALALAACAVGAQAYTGQIKTHVAGGTLYADRVTTTNNSDAGPVALRSVQNQTTGDRVAGSMLATVDNSNTGYTAGQYSDIRWSSTGYQDVLQVTAVVNAVPEPQAHALLLGGLGLMAIAAVSRRQRKHGK